MYFNLILSQFIFSHRVMRCFRWRALYFDKIVMSWRDNRKLKATTILIS